MAYNITDTTNILNVPLEKLLFHTFIENEVERGSYMSDHGLLNLLNELGEKR